MPGLESGPFSTSVDRRWTTAVASLSYRRAIERSSSASEDRLDVRAPRVATFSIAFLVVALVLAGAEAPGSREGLIAFEPDYSIYTVQPDGSDLRVLAEHGQRDPGGVGDGYLVYPSFTPDGSREADARTRTGDPFRVGSRSTPPS